MSTPAMLPSLHERLPLAILDVVVGSHPWQITCVRNRAGLATAGDHHEYDLYGFLLWESAVGLARKLTQQAALVQG